MAHQLDIPEGKKIYFASDFHLGAPNEVASFEREKKIIRWLDESMADAAAFFIVGDIFDFWFEYKYVIPKGFIRLQGKLAEISDKGIPLILFTGNHDMWMFDYFPRELNAQLFRDPQVFTIGQKQFYIGHGDGLGPGDYKYKMLKRVFNSRLCQWAFSWIHPHIGMWIANTWSNQSRSHNLAKDEQFQGEEEWIFQYCREMEKQAHYDYYIFGHRHLPIEMEVAQGSYYFNLGEWMKYFTYGTFDGNVFQLLTFDR